MGNKRRIKCTNRKCEGHRHEICIDEQIELGNFCSINGIKIIECPYCGLEIIL